MGLRLRLPAAKPINDDDRSEEGRGRTALVTGGSSGIGRSLSVLLAAKGYSVIPVARRTHLLEELQAEIENRWQGSCQPLVVDLGLPTAARTITGKLAERGVHVDFLVNNAGYGLVGGYAKKSWDELERFVRVMALTPLELTRYLLPPMLDRRWGRILNVASVFAAMPGSPGMTLYAPTKSMLYKFTEGLAAEAQPYNVYCTVSAPGVTATEILESAGVSSWGESQRLMNMAAMSPDTVARQAYKACMGNRRVIVHGWHHKIWMFSLVHLPAAAWYRLGGLWLRNLDS